jgi:hypothetical protein
MSNACCQLAFGEHQPRLPAGVYMLLRYIHNLFYSSVYVVCFVVGLVCVFTGDCICAFALFCSYGGFGLVVCIAGVRVGFGFCFCAGVSCFAMLVFSIFCYFNLSSRICIYLNMISVSLSFSFSFPFSVSVGGCCLGFCTYTALSFPLLVGISRAGWVGVGFLLDVDAASCFYCGGCI